MGLAEFRKLTSLMFAAALDQSRWIDFLKELSRVNGGIHTQIFGHDLKSNFALDLVHYMYQGDFIDQFLEHYSSINAFAPALINAEVGRIMPVDDMIPRRDLLKTEFYNDWLRPQGSIIGGGGALLHKDETRFFAIGGNIAEKDTDRLQNRWLQNLEILLPSLQHSFEISRTLGGKTLEVAAFNQIGGQESTSIFLLNSEGRIIFHNSGAAVMLDTGRIVRLGVDNRFTINSLTGADALKRALNSLKNRDSGTSSAFSVNDNETGSTYIFRIAAFDPDMLESSPFGFNISFSEPYLLLTVTPVKHGHNTAAQIIHAYRLTASEADVALKIADGLSLNEISAIRSVSIHTVRSQLKSAMSKMEQRRQSGLVRLIEQIRNHGI